jgi:hypothetical protein
MIVGRKRPDQMNQLEPIQKQILVVERRPSQVEKARRPSQAERRQSQLQVRVPEKIETSAV